MESSTEPLPSETSHGSPAYADGFGAVDGLSRRSESEGGAEPRPTGGPESPCDVAATAPDG